MPTNIPPAKPKFIQNVTSVQITLAGIAGSMFIAVLITLIPWVIDLFADKYLISKLREYMALASLALTGCIGIPQILGLAKWLKEFYEYYENFKKFNESKEKKD